MTEGEYQKKLESGFDESKINNYYSIMLLMNRAQEQMTIDIKEYLAEYNIRTMNINLELKGIEGRFRNLASKIMPIFRNEKGNQAAFFEDYDEFMKLIKSFVGEG